MPKVENIWKINYEIQLIWFFFSPFNWKKVLGACWYLLSIERQEACWRSACDLEKPFCEYGYFDCHKVKGTNRQAWFRLSNATTLCNPDNGFYQFGIYGDAVTYDVTNATFVDKYFYCLWWGLRNLRYIFYHTLIKSEPTYKTRSLLVMAFNITSIQNFIRTILNNMSLLMNNNFVQFLGTESFNKHFCWRNHFCYNHSNCWASPLCIAHWKYASKSFANTWRFHEIRV